MYNEDGGARNHAREQTVHEVVNGLEVFGTIDASSIVFTLESTVKYDIILRILLGDDYIADLKVSGWVAEINKPCHRSKHNNNARALETKCCS